VSALFLTFSEESKVSKESPCRCEPLRAGYCGEGGGGGGGGWGGGVRGFVGVNWSSSSYG